MVTFVWTHWDHRLTSHISKEAFSFKQNSFNAVAHLRSMRSPTIQLSTAVLTGLNSDYLKNPQMAHTMPFTAEKLPSVFKFSFMSLNILRPALTNNHLFVNKLISELQLCRSEEDRKVHKYEDNLPVKYKHDKCYRTLEVGQPIRSTGLYPAEQQPYEAIQLGGVAEGRYRVHTPLRALPFQLFFCCSFWKALGFNQAGLPCFFHLSPG